MGDGTASGSVRDPPGPSAMLLSMETGGERVIESRLELQRALATLGTSGNSFAILALPSGGLIQAAGTVARGFVVEYREGADGQNWQSNLPYAHSEVIEVFFSCFDRPNAWKPVSWRRLSSSERGDASSPEGAWSPLLLLTLGTLLLGAAAHAGYQAQDRSANLGTARGELVSSRDCGRGNRCIRVRYTVGGAVHLVDARVAKATLNRLSVVVYDRRDPRLAWVGPEAVWYRCQGFASLGGIMVVASGVSILRRWIARRDARALTGNQHR